MNKKQLSDKMRTATQWIVTPSGIVPSPVTPYHSALAPGMYTVECDMNGLPVFKPRPLEADELFNLPDSPAFQLVQNVRKFWASAATFEKLGLVHKRGVLLHGAPGGGKTAAAEILAKDIIDAGGVVLTAARPWILDAAIVALRAIEPDRHIAVILEDVDELMGDEYDAGQESDLCKLLDGESQVGGVVYCATTNHLEALPPRFANRPSRFDEVVEIGAPSLAMRIGYLGSKIPLGMTDDATVSRWAADTEGLMIAHLRELIVGCLALGRPYEEVLGRLRALGPVAEAAHPTSFGASPLGQLFNTATDETNAR